MALNFADVASKPIGEIEKPPLPPVGTYRWQITKLPVVTTSKDDLWDFVTYNVRAKEALDDVEITDYPGEVHNITSQVKFVFNKEDEVEFGKTEYQHRRFLEEHVQCCTPKDTIAQAMNASNGQEFLGYIAWNQDKHDKELFHANITRTAPLE